MPGPVPIDEKLIKPLSDYATKDAQGNWRAGSEAPGYEKGQFIPTTTDAKGTTQPGGDVGRAYTNRKRTNLVKANMRRNDMTESEAREHVNDKLEKLADEKDREDPDTDEIRDIRKALHGS